MLSTIRVRLVLFFGSALLLPAQQQLSPDRPRNTMLTNAAAQLAARISSLLPRRATVSLEVQNLSALSPRPSGPTSAACLQDELRKAGCGEMAATPPESRGVRVTLSERRARLAVRGRGLHRRQSADRDAAVDAAGRHQAKPRLSISKKLLFTQPEPILDTLAARLRFPAAGLKHGEVASLSPHGGQMDAVGNCFSACCLGPCRAIHAGGWNRRRTDFESICLRRLARGLCNPN